MNDEELVLLLASCITLVTTVVGTRWLIDALVLTYEVIREQMRR